MGSVRRATWRQYFIFLGANVLLSALTVLLVLSLWDRRVRALAPTPTATVDVIAQVANAVPSSTPTLPPSPTPHIYVVRSGDTLMEIALSFEISLEELMEANDLDDPNALTAGQRLIIPTTGLPIEAGLAGATPRLPPPATQTPAPTSQVAQVVIYGVEGVGELGVETVRLLNTGGEVSMAGWTLEDGEAHVYTFPAFTFYTTGAVDLHTRTGTDTSIDLYWGLDEAVWSPGKMITLRNAEGVVQSTFQIPER